MTAAKRKPRVRYNKAMRAYADKQSAQAQRRVADYMQLAVLIATDGNVIKRAEAAECVACFYLRPARIVGHAFTDWACGSCGESGSHPSTGVPRYCVRCAHSCALCTRCGGHTAWPIVSYRDDAEREAKSAAASRLTRAREP